ncbi:MAG: response regulator [Balneolaceae bacterium]|nr:response regulator [Balneolaceae bacterium]
MGKDIPKKVLIVEDDLLLSLVEERIIEKMGYAVVDTVTTAEEAVEQNRKLRPDLILMDIILQGEMDGIDAMEEIRKESDVPVIYLSGNSDRYNYERARKTDFTDYLVKPITGPDLVEPFRKAFDDEVENRDDKKFYSSNNGMQFNKSA